MQALETYLTKEGWKADLRETKEDFRNIYNRSYKGLTDIIRNEEGKTSTNKLLFACGTAFVVFGVSSLIGEDPKVKTAIAEFVTAAGCYALMLW